MSGIKQWAFSVCAAMIACGIAQMILPRGGMEKIFRVTVSVFFLCCLLSPVVIRSPDLRLELSEYSQADIQRRADRLNQVVQGQTGDSIRWQLRKIIAEKLGEKGINYHDVTINISINGQSEPQVDSVKILLDPVHKQEGENIRAALERELGLDIQLAYRDGVPEEE